MHIFSRIVQHTMRVMAWHVRPAGRPNEFVTDVHSSVSDLEWRDKLQADVVVVVVAR